MPAANVAPQFRFGHIVVEPTSRRVLVHDKPARLGARAFDVLQALIEHRERVVGKNELMALVWPGLVVEENNLQVHISSLRKVLGPHAIMTVPGRGYRFTAALEQKGAASTPGVPEPAAAVPEPAPGNLPASLPQLYGRDADVADLQALVLSHRLVSVVGAGGMGKTRLAQATARSLQDRFEQGAWIVELASLTDPSLLAAAVAQALGLILPGVRAADQELLDALTGRDMLLVLDNGEHLVGRMSALVQALVVKAPSLHLLVTSQELLKVQGEHLYRLRPLAVPDDADLARARESGAVALFVDRVEALLPGFALSEHNVLDVIDICRRLDGLPLAIELAAARVPLLGVSGVRQRLDERFRVLSGGARPAMDRHQTLLKTMDWSHGLLSSGERAVFRRAAAFVGGFTLGAAQQALVDGGLDEWAVLDHLGALVDKSLVVADGGEPPRYRLLETTRAYALDKLREAGEAEATSRRHAQAMLALFERSYAERCELPTNARLERYLPDLDNLRAALDWAAGPNGDADLQIALTGAVAWLWPLIGQRPEGLRRGQLALARVGPATAPALEARLQNEWCTVAYPLTGARELAAGERAILLYRQLGERKSLFLALANHARALALNGQFAATDAAVQEAAALYDSRWPAPCAWPLLVARATLRCMQGRYEEGRELYESCLNLAKAVGDTHLIVNSLIHLEQAASSLGRVEEAVERGRDLVERLKHERFRSGEDVARANLASALAEQGLLDEALATAREALPLLQRSDCLFGQLDPFALLDFRRGRFAQAALVLGYTENAYASLGNRREPNEQRARDMLLAGLQQVLPPAQLQSLLAQGAALAAEEAAALVLGD